MENPRQTAGQCLVSYNLQGTKTEALHDLQQSIQNTTNVKDYGSWSILSSVHLSKYRTAHRFTLQHVWQSTAFQPYQEPE
jgi:hypothetical protein